MYAESKIKSLEWSIRFNKKALLTQIGVVVLNFFGFVWNVYAIFHGEIKIASGFAAGVFLSNVLWSLAMTLSWWGETKRDKFELKLYKDLEAKEEIAQDRERYENAAQQHKNAEEQYIKLRAKHEQLIHNLMMENKDLKANQRVSVGGVSINLEPASMDNSG